MFLAASQGTTLSTHNTGAVKLKQTWPTGKLNVLFKQLNL